MTLVDASLYAIGGFYVFAGVVGARAAVAGRALDRMIAVIARTANDLSQEAAEDDAGARQDGPPTNDRAATDATERAEAARGAWLLAGSLAVLLAGAALVLRLDVARWVFMAAALLQAVYLFYVAPVHLDAADPVDDAGRRQTSNAFVLFAAATAYVLWAGWRGRLLPLAAVRPEVLAVVGMLYLGFIGYTIWGYTRPLPSRGDDPR